MRLRLVNIVLLFSIVYFGLYKTLKAKKHKRREFIDYRCFLGDQIILSSVGFYLVFFLRIIKAEVD